MFGVLADMDMAKTFRKAGESRGHDAGRQVGRAVATATDHPVVPAAAVGRRFSGAGSLVPLDQLLHGPARTHRQLNHHHQPAD